MLEVYKAKGEAGIASYKSKQKAQAQAKSLKAAESPVDTDVLQRIRSISKETGISEAELLKQFQAAKEASK